VKRSPLKRRPTKRRTKAVSPASPAQRAKVREVGSIITGERPCDPAHLVPRSLGGCDDPLCVVPLTREQHRKYDRGELDLEPYLIHHYVPELQHALAHTHGSLSRLLRIIEGER